MADWIDTLGDVIFRIAGSFVDAERPKRVIGIAFAAITAFGTIGTLAAIALGVKLAPAGYFVFLPALLMTTAVAGYCFWTDRAR